MLPHFSELEKVRAAHGVFFEWASPENPVHPTSAMMSSEVLHGKEEIHSDV